MDSLNSRFKMIRHILFFILIFLSVSTSAQECEELFGNTEQSHFKAKQALIVGGGSYGTAFAQVLSKNFERLFIITRNKQIVDQINKFNISDKLPGIALSSNIRGTTQWEDFSNSEFDLIALALPIQEIRLFLQKNRRFLSPLLKEAPLISLSKGIDMETLSFSEKIISKELKNIKKGQLYFLSGPSFASEMAQGRKTLVNLSGYEDKGLEKVKDLITTDHFQISLTKDIVGVSFSGAAKNILAIASGIAKGLKTGHNTRLALILKINEELMSIGKSLGAKEESFWSPAYFGDIVLSLEEESRNTRFGIAIGKGISSSEFFKQNKKMHVEGFGTVKALYFLVKENFSAPFLRSLYQILYENKDPEDLLAIL